MADEYTENGAAGEAGHFDARLAEGVAYFEQMLEIMPEDRTTLEFLVVAYEQLDEHEKGQKALVSLVKLLINERDTTALQGLIPRLEASDFAPAQALLLKVKTMTAPLPDLTPEGPKELTEEGQKALYVKAAVESERALADALHAAGVLDDEAHAMVREQLDAVPTDGRLFLVSALQILEKENVGLFERAVEWLADTYGAPPVPLAAFDVTPAWVRLYPEALARLRGVVPFAKLGGLTLAVTLNPADEALRAEVEALGPCRFYLADPASVEAELEKAFGAVV